MKRRSEIKRGNGSPWIRCRYRKQKYPIFYRETVSNCVQFALMQIAGEIEYINFPTNTIFIKRSKESIIQPISIKSNDNSQAYLPVKFNDLSFEIRCLQCGSVFIHKLVEPNGGPLCTRLLRLLKRVTDQFESAPTRVSLDPEETKEYENGDRPKADDRA